MSKTMKGKKADPGAVVVAVECIIKHEVEKALLVKAVEGRDSQNWIAKSQLKKPTVQIEEKLWIIYVPTWIANANGWEYEDEVRDISEYEEVPPPPPPLTNKQQTIHDDEFDDDIPF